MAVTCCRKCKSHGQSLVDFNLDGNGKTSEKPSDQAFRENISHRTQFHFPIPGYTEQEKYGAELGYWPLVQTPGVAYIINTDKQYTTYDEISDALLNGEVTGALIDTYVLGSRKDLFEIPSLRLIKIYDYSTAYGVALGGDARKLRRCFRKYVQGHKKKIFQAIEEHVEFVKESPVPLAVERSTGLFDSESAMYKTIISLSSVLLLVFLTAGVMWELARRLKIRRTVATERDRLKLLVHNTRSDMSRTVEDFTVRIKALVEDLKAKHAKERLTLLNRLKSIPRTGRKYSTTLGNRSSTRNNLFTRINAS
ncbi:hypothetical protein OS493_034171 [Desmophyllum pertusum]|uniref:Uncharacterized protein n=1 Tax=Desmophyllum pertusum TaxID=174260 RepID=A0A9X0D757_9CNID|nr:hypothetical protein OS493_034171 [Desmophyllum pertusum]